MNAYIDLLEKPGEFYRNAADLTRRALLQALFTRMLVRVVDDEGDVSAERTEINATLHDWQQHHRYTTDRDVDQSSSAAEEKRKEGLPCLHGRPSHNHSPTHSVQRFE